MAKLIRIEIRQTKKVKEYNRALRKGAQTRFVYKHPQGWAVVRHGAKKPSNIFKLQAEAIKRATELARKAGSAVVIQDAKGGIKRVVRV